MRERSAVTGRKGGWRRRTCSRRSGRAVVGALVIAGAVASVALAAHGTQGLQHRPAALLSHDCGGHERWAVKVLTDDHGTDVKYATPIAATVEDLRGLERPAKVGPGAA